MAETKICGVYKITNQVNGKIYVGSSNNVKNRWGQHKRKLNEQCHGNAHLQRAWDLYGGENFVFEIIEECDQAVQFEREQHYLNALNPFDANGYNLVRQISKEYDSDHYITRICEQCGCEYNTFSHKAKYCDECKKERKLQFLEDRYWMQGNLVAERMMYDGYGSAEYFWECNS